MFAKTHLLCAIAQELIFQGRRVLFRPCDLLVQELLVAKRDLYPTAPQATGSERHPEADRVPVLDGEARRRLAYGLQVQADRGNRNRERKNADKLKNYGRTGWGAQLTERYEAGKFRGLELRAQMNAAEVNQWREGVERKAKRAREREKATDV